MNHKSIWASLFGAIGTSIVASLCCIGPLVVLSLGIGGAWTSHLTALSPYRPYVIGFVILSLGYSFYKLYLRPPACEINKPCAHPQTLFIQRLVFWVISLIILLLLTFPWYGSRFF